MLVVAAKRRNSRRNLDLDADVLAGRWAVEEKCLAWRDADGSGIQHLCILDLSSRFVAVLVAPATSCARSGGFGVVPII